MEPVAKILGADVELGNAVERPSEVALASDLAARLLLAEIDGIPSVSRARSRASPYPVIASGWSGDQQWGQWAGYGAAAADYDDRVDPQDRGRKFLPTNAGSVYIDLNHLEVCMPEVRSARDFVAYHAAGLAIGRAARDAAQAGLDDDERLVLMANNSDRQGNSWGGHLNVLISRALWDRVFGRMYPELFVLAAFQVSSILYTGQGKVGSENGKPWVPFQLTQRGDFFECVEGLQTTYRRPIVNTRDEAHCARNERWLARLHVIFHDTTLSHTSNYLKAGVTQLVLALMETGWCDKQVMLEDPLQALTAWGHDQTLHTAAPLADGRCGITAIDHQRLFIEAVEPFVASGAAEPFVPGATEIFGLWSDTIERLARGDTEVLARRLDWVLKRELLVRAIDRNPGLTWESPAIRAADLRFASLGSDGLFAAVEAAGGVDAIVSSDAVERAMREPPEDTRAWARAMLLREAGASGVEYVNWDEIRLRPDQPGGETQVLRLSDPRRMGRAECELSEPSALSPATV